MNCLVIDDNPKTSKFLLYTLREIVGEANVHYAIQPYVVGSMIDSENIDVVFTRVRLWNSEMFQKIQKMPAMVFVTSGREKFTEQPETTVPYRLTEPFTTYNVEVLLNKVRKEPNIEKPDYLFIRSDLRYHRLYFDQIKLIERPQIGYIKVYTDRTNYTMSGYLPPMLKRLPEGQFIRVSDTLILPISEVSKIADDTYIYGGREIKLTYKFAESARKEQEQHADWR